MNGYSSPEMSVVMVTPDCYETIRKTMSYFRKQTVRDRLEVVIVAPSVEELGLDASELEDFLQFRVVAIGALKSVAQARAVGIRQASAPVVLLAEDHSYPDPGLAEALIKAHRQSWAVVGPIIGNANPDRIISWATHFIQHGRWAESTVGGVVDDLPGHCSAYKRSILVDYGPELEAMLEAESVLHWDLQAKGYQLYLEPAAKTYHVNMTRPFSCVLEQYHYGRLFGAARARRWSRPKRLLYIGGTPLIPLVRLRRVLRQIRGAGRERDLLPGVLPPLILGLVVSALGEMTGYAFGAGDAPEQMCVLEFHRYRHLAASDRGACMDP